MTHLRAMAERPNVSVSVVPFSIGTTPGRGHTFSLLDLPEGYAKPVVYAESALAATYTDSSTEVAARKAAFGKIKAVSVPIGEFV
jgi:hypothetical protein